jgi:eukaryotic-like serine/threonine-protein kinase
MADKKIFFISRAGADKRWAELVASVVRDAGHEAIYQDAHFQVGQSFIDNMTRAAESDCTIAILSPDYFNSEYCLSELNSALAKDPLGRRGRVVPVRVKPVEIPSLLGQLAYLDLVGADDESARQRLVTMLHQQGQVDATKLALVGRTRRAVEHGKRDRSAMIDKVRSIWVTRFLRQSLFHEARILLGLSERPDAVARPLDLLVKRPDEGERPLPSHTRIVDLFDSMDRSLLILGAPGAGKTTLLLELASDLLDRADKDPAHAIPVVFPLSTWAQLRKPLVEWLHDELNLRYDVPRATAREWVASDQVLPLLDGLDEVKPEHRPACAQAINDFRRSHGFLAMAITSRTADYETLSEPLRLEGAVVVRPLSSEQVNDYLIELGPSGEPVRVAIQEDPSLRDLIDSPLLLNVVTVACAGGPEIPHQMTGHAAERRDHLFESYVSAMLRRRAAERRYTPKQTVHWLRWLAHQMVLHGETVFYLERLQRDWLPEAQRRTIRRWNDLVLGLVFGLPVAVAAGLDFGPWLGLLVGLMGAYGGPVGVRFLRAFGGLFGGLTFRRFFRLIIEPMDQREAFPFDWFLSTQSERSAHESAPDPEIPCTETLRWSWSKTCDALPVLLTVALCGGLLGGLIRATKFGLVTGLAGGLFVAGLFIVLFAVPFAGLVVGKIETSTIPNEGIHRSARNAVGSGVLLGLAVWLVAGPIDSLVAGVGGFTNAGPGARIFTGLVCGLLLGIYAGGEAFLRHVWLRLWLIRNGATPWNYVRFLDYAADRILLRKVGGGYVFLHRMLMDYFAARYVEPAVGGKQPAKPSSIEQQS